MTLGWDLDGVFVDFNHGFRALIKQQTGIPITPEMMTTWHYHRAAGVTKKQNDQLWNTIRGSRRWYIDLPPLPDAVKALAIIQRLTDAGVPSYFITSRSGLEVHRQSVRWLESFGLFNPQVLIAKSHLEKALLARGLGLTSYADDAPDNVMAIEAVKVPNVFIVDNYYNRAEEFVFKKSTRRASSPMEVLNILTKETKAA